MKAAQLSVYSGTPWEKKVAYCRAKRVGNVIAVSGTVAAGADGRAIALGDAYTQTLFVLRKIEAALVELGSGLHHVIRTRTFLADLGYFDEFARAHREVFEGIDPAATAVEVTRLIAEDFLIEIEADAIVDD